MPDGGANDGDLLKALTVSGIESNRDCSIVEPGMVKLVAKSGRICAPSDDSAVKGTAISAPSARLTLVSPAARALGEGNSAL